MGNSVARIPYDLKLSVRGPLKDRVFNIPDELIEEFLENDIELLMRNYVRTMAPDVELTDRFGSVDLEDQRLAIISEYEDLAANATPRQRKRLEAEGRKRAEDVEALSIMLSNRQYGGGNPMSGIARAARSVRDVNFLSKLGGMTLSAIPDVGSIAIANGVMRSFKGVGQLLAAPQRFKMTAKTLKENAVGLDMTLNTRAGSIADLDDIYARNTMFERGLKQASAGFSKITLMAPWNAGLKQFAGVVTQSRLLEGVTKVASGKTNKALNKRLSGSGISEDMALRIADQYAKHGDPGTINLPMAHLWDDLEAAETLQAAILKDVDRAIVTPGKGEKPLWMNSETGKLIGQFKTFAISAHHKILLANLQYRDAQAVNGALMMMAFGGVAYASKQYAAGRDISTEPEKLLVEALDRSGLMGFFSDVNNTVEKVSRGTIGMNALLGESPMSRYASRNITGSVLGPSFGTAEDIFDIAGDVSSNEMDEGTIRSIRKLLPGQNIFYIRRMLNSLEEEIAQ